MDAALAWEIVGSVAAVVAVPMGFAIGLAQVHASRKDARALFRQPDQSPGGNAFATQSIDDREGKQGGESSGSSKRGNRQEAVASNKSTLATMHLMAGYRNWEQLRTLAMSHPDAAVLATWKTLTFVIYKNAYIEKCAVSEDWHTELPLIALRMGADRQTVDAISDMQQMRDRAEYCHVMITRSDALEYVDAAEAILDTWLGEDGSVSDEHCTH